MRDPLKDFLDPGFDRKDQVIAFFAAGSENVLSVSRPTLYGRNDSPAELIGWFFEMLDRVDEVRRMILDKLERQAIRSRILEQDKRLGKPGLF